MAKVNGKMFSTEYQPKEKWSEDKALQLGNDLIEWLKKADENIFFEEFLYLENDYYPALPAYLANKFPSFLNLLRQAKKIQEVKIVKFSAFDKLNSQISKFVLINKHNWAEKNHTDITTKGREISSNLATLTTEELIARAEAVKQLK